MILVAGEALVDVFEDGSARPGGSPFNVAIGLARLGARAALLTRISDDAHGLSLRRALEREGVETGFLHSSSRPTPTAAVRLGESGSPAYAFTGLADLEMHPSGPLGAGVTGFHIGSYGLVSPRSSEPLLEAFAGAPPGVLRSVDPNIRLSMEPSRARWRAAVAAFAAQADLLKVSEEDLRTLFGAGADVDSIARSWLSDRCRLVGLTRGERGATLFTKNGRRLDSRAPPIAVADSVGAGDAFQAALIAGLAEGRGSGPAPDPLGSDRLQWIFDRATRAGALACARPGADPPTRSELDSAFPRPFSTLCGSDER